MPAPADTPRRPGIELSTLAITAIASAVAAYVVSKLWAPGTLAAAAMTPVFVAVLKEALQRPVERVVTVAPVIVGRRTGEPTREPADEAPPVRVHSTARRARGVRIAIVTGILGFLIAAAVLTIPDLVAGESVVGGKGHTTLFGGDKHKHAGKSSPASTTTTEQRPAQTVTAPGRTVTAPAPEATTTAPPAQPTTTAPPPPITTAPAPDAQEPPVTAP